MAACTRQEHAAAPPNPLRMEDLDMFMHAAWHEGAAAHARRKRRRAAWWGGSCRIELPAAGWRGHRQPVPDLLAASEEALQAHARCVVGADLRAASAKQLQRAFNCYADKAERRRDGGTSAAAAWSAAGAVSLACTPLAVFSLALAPVAAAGVARGVDRKSVV